MKIYKYLRLYACIDGWMNGCKSEGMDTWLNMHLYLRFYACMDG